MLKSIRLRNYRSFSDSHNVFLHKLNIMLGSNNVGKTTFLSAIELFMRSLNGGVHSSPLAFSEMPAFASFDAVLRKHWSKKEHRPHELELDYSFISATGRPARLAFTCIGDAGSNASIVSKALYESEKKKASVWLTGKPSSSRLFRGILDRKHFGPGSIFFDGVWPIFGSPKSKDETFSFQFVVPPNEMSKRHHLEVIHPFRPIPRTYYVLDDPGLSTDERGFVSYLATVWQGGDTESKQIRETIQRSLRTLGLTGTFEVVRITQKRGPNIMEIRVSPQLKRQKVTIADAGFGLSQVLPLVVADSRLRKGTLIAYQPEVHLHPFAQSRLADLFVQSARRGNQVFVETHSPDLVLRLQKLIAESQIAREDVAFYCFENTRGVPKIDKVQLDEKARPTVPWPSGFLDTSLTLAKDLAKARGYEGASK